MHASSFDLYHAGTSPWHGLDARVKLIITLAYVLTVSLMPVGSWPAYVLLLAFAVSVSVASELGVLVVLKRASVALPFVLAALPLLVTTPGNIVLSIPVGRWLIPLTSAGIGRFLSIALKSWLSVQMAVLLTATTPLPDLLLAMRGLHLPGLLVATVGLMWRYLFVLVDEAVRMTRAREARSAGGEGRRGSSIIWRARVTGSMAGSIFLRGYERSERIYTAMLSRGYDGTIRSLPVKPVSAMQRCIAALVICVLLVLLWLGQWMRYRTQTRQHALPSKSTT